MLGSSKQTWQQRLAATLCALSGAPDSNHWQHQGATQAVLLDTYISYSSFIHSFMQTVPATNTVHHIVKGQEHSC